jgi:sporulation protein YlmC with PRC-barrel domain
VTKLSALIGLPVVDSAGAGLGRLQELHAVDGVVTKLSYGPAGLFERLTGRGKPVAIPWSRVRRVGAEAIELD